MTEHIVFESPDFACRYYPTLNTLVTEQKQEQVTFAELKRVNGFELEYIKANGLTCFCISTAPGYEPTDAEKAWLKKTHIPALVFVGIRHLASIANTGLADAMQCQQQPVTLETEDGRAELRFCQTKEEALIWFAQRQPY